MPKLTPLKQFYCDVCKQLIADPHDGYVLWERDNQMLAHDFKIIHQSKCDDGKAMSSSALEDFLGPNGLIELLSLADPGSYQMPTFKLMVKDVREWLEFLRRVQVPYYEEARRYWKWASAEYFDDVNEVRIFQADYLKKMIESAENASR